MVLYLAGLAALTLLQITWVAALHYNLMPWIDAGKQMTVLRSKLLDLTKNPKVKSIVLLNVPSDFSGAGMVGNQEILHRMLKPPVADADYTGKIVLFSPPTAEMPDAIDRELLKRTYDEKKGAHWLQWSKDQKQWVEWEMPTGLQTFSVNDFTWDNHKAFSSASDPRDAFRVWMKTIDPIDPFCVDGIELKCDGADIKPEMAKQVQLLWRSANQPKSWIDYSEGPQAHLIYEYDEHGQTTGRVKALGFQPLHYRSWLLNGSIVEIGFKLQPGQYTFRPLEVKSSDSSVLTPSAQKHQ